MLDVQQFRKSTFECFGDVSLVDIVAGQHVVEQTMLLLAWDLKFMAESMSSAL